MTKMTKTTMLILLFLFLLLLLMMMMMMILDRRTPWTWKKYIFFSSCLQWLCVCAIFVSSSSSWSTTSTLSTLYIFSILFYIFHSIRLDMLFFFWLYNDHHWKIVKNSSIIFWSFNVYRCLLFGLVNQWFQK